MGTYRFIVLANPTEGREADFNEWYDSSHLRDLLEVDGFDAAQRFKRIATPGGDAVADAPYQYLTIYEVETDDPDQLLADMGAQARKSHSDAIDLSRTVAWWFEPVTAKRTA